MKKTILASIAVALALPNFASNITHNESDNEGDSLLNEVLVTGTRSATTSRNLPVTVSVIDREALIANERTNILPTLSELVPGMMVTQRGMMGFGVSGGAAGGISVRGLSAGTGQVLVLIDGQPQYQGVFGHSIGDSYQTMMAEKVEVVRGPASVLYGSNAMGGVVNIITRGMKQDGVQTHLKLGAGSYGTVQTEVSNQVRKGRFSSTVAAQYGRSDNHRPRMGFEQYGGYAKVAYDISDNWNAFADIDLTHFNASYPGSTDKPLFEADQWITRGVATLGVENHYSQTNGRISVYDNFGIHKINDGYAEGAKPQTELFRSKDALAGVSWYQSFNLIQGNNITLGMDYQHIYGRAYYTSRETGETVTTGRRGMQSTHTHSNEIAGYVDVRQDISQWLTLDAGIRLDSHSAAGTEWIPQFGLVLKPITDGTLKATVSKGFRNPTTKELYLYGTANDTLHAERMWNYEIAWRQSLLQGAVTYGVNLFLMEGDNMIATVPMNGGQKNINTGDFLNRGAELEASWRINSHWRLNTNHSLLHMDKPLEGCAKYKGYLGADIRYGNWTATVGATQVSGLYTVVSKDTKESFTLVNATLGYQLNPNIRLWVKGENLLGKKYEYISGYPMPGATFMGGVNVRI